jgi:hypothetical protein
MFEDGIPPLAPSPGHMTVLHWMRDGKCAPTVVEIHNALPAGHYHLATYSTDPPALMDISLAPVPAGELSDHVRRIVEGDAHGSHFLWLPSQWASGPATERHPRIGDLS